MEPFPFPLPAVADFYLQKRERLKRTLFFLGIKPVHASRAYEWLLPGFPPLKPGEARVAIYRGERTLPEEPLFEEGSCTLDPWRHEGAVGEFQGKKFRGRYFFHPIRKDQWLLLAGNPSLPPGVRFTLSAGGVLLRSGERDLEVLLIQPRGRKRYTLPKGTVEPGETLEGAALREVHEETGVRGKILGALDPIEYWFSAREKGKALRIHKVVVFFLMEPLEEVPPLPPARDEVEKVLWAPVSWALPDLVFDNERQLLTQAVSLWEHLSGQALGSS